MNLPIGSKRFQTEFCFGHAKSLQFDCFINRSSPSFISGGEQNINIELWEFLKTAGEVNEQLVDIFCIVEDYAPF